MNFMVMSGTRDAFDIISKLNENPQLHITATTTTSYGSQMAKDAGAHEVVPRGLKKEELVNLISQKKIDVLIDATHPFAVKATRNAISASKATGIYYIRFERPPVKIQDNPLIIKTLSFKEASRVASTMTKGNIMHLAGVSTLDEVISHNDPDKVFVRVLPVIDSVEKCLEIGLKPQHIIAMQGTFSKNFNKALLEEYKISLIITKESGEAGGTPSKLAAALELGLNVVMIMRPQIKELEEEKVVHSMDEILNILDNK
ncbi:MAG: precorrin-6A reductase [Euryarchaeota archaeon]|nr:precorrin-6A reductase [Euryarchaeota archaeon]MBV1730368.1 precorrin-6A reductase [Methanobacterium sp.]MBU4548112.1 precorrin-6A reductase [Euryarchaeota archaeon]MBU4607469.1 precorrin-6A reductase [Euryarchaeota archaeon]MBV1754328.1 precorrin-6A reductase [Methanobacterium sp.]